MLTGALPIWPHSSSWDYFLSGGLGTVLVAVLVLMFIGVIWAPAIAQPSSRGITMRYVKLATAALLGLTGLQALAQVQSGANPAAGARPGHEIGVGNSLPLSNKASNIVSADTRSNIAPTLPASAAGPNATTHEYLAAARTSLVAGRTGQAQQSLEMAETRALDRSVEPGQISTPSSSQLVSGMRAARLAMATALVRSSASIWHWRARAFSA
jgi:hypothetical protein